MNWRIELFGGPRIVAPDGSVFHHFPTQKSAGLLAYLALTLPRTHPREVLAELFWPEKDPTHSRNSLSVALSALRPLLGEALVADRLRVGLDPAVCATDVAAFEARLAAEDMDVAAQLCAEELLPGFYDDWAQQARERVAVRFDEVAAAVARRGAGERGRLHRFPLMDSVFVGRDDECAQVGERLRGAARLVTVKGMGGSGKTRLAHEAARRLAADFPGGLVWVALDDARTSEDLLRRVADVLRVTLQPRGDLAEQLGRVLAPRGRILLVLDNLEQIADAAVGVRALLESAPECRCLATSRLRLGLRAETVLELPPLPLDDARRLFVERAEAALAGGALPPGSDDAVAELCRRLDGLPLALELAAARSALLTPAQLLARIEERFPLLQSRSPDLPVRQRTLRAAIDSSTDLLDPQDRALLADLSVLVGSFTLEEVAAVCGGALPLDGLQTLQEGSLLHAERPSGRLFLLESLRVYAAERLAEAPDRQAQVRRRHAAHFLTRAEAQIARLRTGDEAEALRRLDALAANLRAALDHGPEEWAPRLALAIARPLQLRGFFAEAAATVERGLAVQRLPELVWERAGLHADRNETEPAWTLAQEARRRYAERGDTVGVGRSENLMGHIRYKEGRWAEARALLEQAEATLETAGDEDRTVVRNNRALVEMGDPDGDTARAAELLTAVLSVRRARGHRRGIAAVVANLGNLAFARGDGDAARAYFTESLAEETALGHVFGIARALNNLGETAALQGAATEALRLYAAAHQLFVELGHDYAAYTESLLRDLQRDRAIPEEGVAAARRRWAGRGAEAIACEVLG